MISEEAKSKLRRHMELREARDVAKKALEDAERDFRESESEVYLAIQESDMKGTIKVDLGPPWGVVSFRNRATPYARIIDEDAALKYFTDRAMKEELQAPKFVKKRLNSIVRTVLETDGDMPPGIDYYTQYGVTITRQK